MMGFLEQLAQQGQPGYFQPQINRGFANSGRAHNDMLARFGGQLPPNPTPHPSGGFLSGLMSAAGTHGQAPEEARVSQPRAPEQGGGFLDSLHGNVSDNRGMLMGLGTGLLSNGWAGAGQAMGGMQYDEARRAQAEQEQQAEAQQAAMGQLGEQYGINPLVFEAGMGERALSQAMRPAEPGYSILSPEQATQMGLPENGRYQMGPNGRVSQIGGGGTNVTVNNGGGTGVGMEEFIKDSVEQATADIDAGNMAARTSMQIDELDRLLQTAPQGMEGALVGAANGMGIPMEGSGDVAAAQAILNQMAPQMRPPGSGPMSDADLRLFQASLPRIINQPGGNQLIIEGMRALNQYDQARGQIAAQYQQSVVSGVPEAQALQQYRQQMNELNASTPSLQSIVGTSGAQTPAQNGSRFTPGPDGVLEFR